MSNNRHQALAPRPKIGVVLASGHIKTFAAIPLIEFLDDMKIDIDLLIGSSGGALMAAVKGAGYSTTQMRELIAKFLDKGLFSKIDYRAVLGMCNLPFGRFTKASGLIKPQRLQETYRRIFKDLRLEDLKPTTLVQATDLTTGEGVVVSRGLVADAVYASSAVFPLFPPLRLDDQWLADGVYTSSLPVMEAVKRGIDIIIAMVFDGPINPDPRKFIWCSHNFTKILSRTVRSYQMALSINLHDYEIVVINALFKKSINIWEVNEIPLILEVGRQAVDEKKHEILAAIKNFSVATA